MNARMKKLTTEAAAVLDELGKDRLDPESDHCKADEVLLEYLDAIGAGELAGAFRRACDRVGFWYA